MQTTPQLSRLLLTLALVPAVLACVACASSGNIAAPECAAYEPTHDAGVTPPKVVHRERPAVGPLDGRRAGYACILATVTTAGTLADMEVVKTDNQVFAERFVAGLAKWRYEPATKDGVAVAYRTLISTSYMN
ncbi:MAG TPA: energy transducer TonB [Thermoanaerobaculia bacterium]|jgi:hypothetical protein|nr:energy transducer TonB [Thermoanaerobaculia bacterium]